MADKNSAEATREVLCRICALDNVDTRLEAKKLIGHIGGKHSKAGWNKAKYVERWGDKDFWHPEPPQQQKVENRERMRLFNEERKRERAEGIVGALETLVTENYDMLSSDEKDFYDQFFEQVVQQTDRDETQMPAISSLAYDIIYVARLRKQQLTLTKKGQSTFSKDLEDVVKKAEERVSKAMDSLGISRAAQLKRGAAIKSTPASIISGYLDEVERNSVEQLDAWRLEETRLYSTMLQRIEEFILSQAPDPEQETEEDANDGKPLSLADALARAGITAGSGAATTEQRSEPAPVEPPTIEGDDELPF